MTSDSQLNGCYASHIILHSGTHVSKIPDHVQDRIASPVNCALATMVNAVSGLDGRNPHRETSAVIQVHENGIDKLPGRLISFVHTGTKNVLLNY